MFNQAISIQMDRCEMGHAAALLPWQHVHKAVKKQHPLSNSLTISYW